MTTFKQLFRTVFLVDLLEGLWVTFRNQHPKYIYTEQYPAERPHVAERFRGAPRLNINPDNNETLCISCNLCAIVCPENLIVVGWDRNPVTKRKDLTTFVYDHADPSDMVVAFNAPFDFAFYSEALFMGGSWNQRAKKFETFRPPMTGPWQCARLACFHKISVDKYDLDTCSAHFGLSRSSDRHGALEDAILAGKLYLALRNEKAVAA